MNPLREDTKPQSIVLQLFVVKVLCRHHLAERICEFRVFPCQINAHEDAPAISQKTSPSATEPLFLSVDQVQHIHLEEENHTRAHDSLWSGVKLLLISQNRPARKPNCQ